jgi:Ca2+-binding EF-hand superfamily protein
MIWKCFGIMDRDESGEVTAEDVKHLYDVSFHEEYKDGTKTKEQIIDEFLDSFDGVKGNDDGKIRGMPLRRVAFMYMANSEHSI